jgi:hypothetical protein
MAEAKKAPHIFVATPMYGGMCAGAYMHSCINLISVASANGVGVSFNALFNESLITRARNTMVEAFERTECTHLMFIDSDIVFRGEDILTMIAADKEIICGVYPKKEINWAGVGAAYEKGVRGSDLDKYAGAFVLNAKEENLQGAKVADPLEILNGGTGFMLIKREVFSKLGSIVPTYTNDTRDLSGSLKLGAPVKEFFTTSIEPESNRLLSEDYHFCRLARLNGMKVWAAPWVRLGHIGTHMFSGQLG